MTLASPSPEDTTTGDSFGDYSPFQITMWFVMFGLGIVFAYCFRASIVRHMERRINNRMNDAQQESSLRRVPADVATARAGFLEKTLETFVWDKSAETNTSGILYNKGKRNDPGVTEESKLDASTTECEEHGKSTKIDPARDDSNSADECSICLANFCNGDRVARSNNVCCPHIFHRDCVHEWLLQHFECPMCRNEFLLPHYVVNLRKCNLQSVSVRDANTPVATSVPSIGQAHADQVNADLGRTSNNEEDAEVELGNISSP